MKRHRLRRRYGHIAIGTGDRLRRVQHASNRFREDVYAGRHHVGYVEMVSTAPLRYQWLVWKDDGIASGEEPSKSLAFEAIRSYVRKHGGTG